jgi:hypothetical protein
MARDYAKEYREYHSKPAQIKRRSARNTARKKVLGGRKSSLDVDHKDRNPRNNSRSNLRLVNKSQNRGRNK